MLSVSNISKIFGDKTVLHNISFSVKSGKHVGLVGPNGSGKSTLLRILIGQEKADTGTIRLIPTSATVAYLPQGLIFREEETIGDYLDKNNTDLAKLSQRLESLASRLAQDNPDETLNHQYDDLLTQIVTASQNEHQVRAVLSGLGLDQFPPETPLRFLSGGQKTRLALACVLISNPKFLILDEPTNHLDIEMLEWLEMWLNHLTIGMLIVSHDRMFLDHVATDILELDPHSHSVKEYSGNYSAYLEKKTAEREHQWQNYLDQQDEIARLHQTASHLRGIAQFKKGGKGDTGDKFARGFFANRSLATVGRAKQIERRIDQMIHENPIEKPDRIWQMKVDFGNTSPSGRDVVLIDEANIGYPGFSALLEDVTITLRYGERVAFIGPNGAGKTTLLRTIAGILHPQKGTVRLGANVNIGYLAQEHENLDFKIDALTTLGSIKPLPETELRSFLSKFLFKGDEVFTPIDQMSYGERSRLSLAILVARGCNFLMLDEPINHLDIASRVRFEEALQDFEGTILAVVHDRYFISAYASSIWEIKNRCVKVVS